MSHWDLLDLFRCDEFLDRDVGFIKVMHYFLYGMICIAYLLSFYERYNLFLQLSEDVPWNTLSSNMTPLTHQYITASTLVSHITFLISSQVRILNEKVKTDATTVYRCGPLIDLCRGPHVRHTGKIKAFCVSRLLGVGEEMNILVWV